MPRPYPRPVSPYETSATIIAQQRDMTMDSTQEEKFEHVLFDAVEQAKAFKYHPSRFVGMIRSKGGFQTVKDIVASSKPSDGFNELFHNERLDLTCEAIIVETSWREFFDDDLLEIAERRLSAHGYASRRFERSELPGGGHNGSAGHTSPIVLETFLPPEGDRRERELRMAHVRVGQSAFRDALFLAYGARCLVTGVSVEQALEAAHICAYRGNASNHIQNGLLLRADIHNLFDRLLLSVDPSTLAVNLHSTLQSSKAYRDLEGVRLDFGLGTCRPSPKALAIHWAAFSG